MNRLKEMYYECRIKGVYKALKGNAEKIRLSFERHVNFNREYSEQLRLMSCRSYLENKLSGVKNAN